jgi:hypothetical protein
LAPLVKKIQEPQLKEIIDSLCALLASKEDTYKEIASIGLKTVILEFPLVSNNKNVAAKLFFRLCPKLIEQIKVGDQ